MSVTDDTELPDPSSLPGSWPVGKVAAVWTNKSGELTTLGPVIDGFGLASVTKPLFSYALLVASEEGTLGLDDALGPPGSTVAHVMAHASGLGPETGDPSTAPGTRRIYSNAGFDLLGAALADAAGMSPADYLREAVCEPLGMSSTWLEGSPAHGAVSTVRDLIRFCDEVLDPVLIHTTTLEHALEPFLPELIGVLPGFGRQSPNPWALGFEIRGTKRPHWNGASAPAHTVGHFGGAGTFLWVDRRARRFAVCLTDTPFGPWAGHAWPLFNEAILRS
ncbi:MAG: beta-lactamase family protein [Acidimicrobiales bacterium]|nr:beta-lactamase family protein [Acidimicrobiales bacterium]